MAGQNHTEPLRSMPRFLRYLRIAFSATCVIACVLLIALWVRSYWFADNLHVPLKAEADTPLQPTLTAMPIILRTSPKMLFVHSYQGRMSISICVRRDDRTGFFHTTFGIDSASAKHLAPRNYYVPTWYWKRDAWGDYVGFPIWLPAVIAGAIGGWSGITAFGFRFSSALC